MHAELPQDSAYQSHNLYEKNEHEIIIQDVVNAANNTLPFHGIPLLCSPEMQ